MFSDPFSNLMLVILLFFIGLLVMFVFIVRSLEHNWSSQEEMRRLFYISLMRIERKLDEIFFIVESDKDITDEQAPNNKLAPEYVDIEIARRNLSALLDKFRPGDTPTASDSKPSE